MRVLLVNDLAPGGGSGTEVHLARLIRALEHAGDTVEVFAGEVTHHGAAKALDLWDPFAGRALAGRAQAFRPDVVHYHNIWRECSAAVLGVAPETARVLTVHDHRLVDGYDTAPGTRWSRGKAMFDRAVTRRRIDIVVTMSQTLADRVWAAGFRDVRVLPNFVGTDVGAMSPPGDDVVYAGRLEAGKGVHVLIEAFGRLAVRHPSSLLCLAGDGPDRPRLEALADNLAPGRVHFEGVVGEDDVRRLLYGARVVCAPSIAAEGFGQLVLEGMAAGRPVVASDQPALRELLGGNDGGRLVPPGDVPALAAALDEFLSDRGRAERAGEQARQAAFARGSDSAIDAIRAVYADARAHRA